MAVGIGLVFGVLRLVNLPTGSSIMAGAYTLAFTSQAGSPTSAGILDCFVVVDPALGRWIDWSFVRSATQSPAVCS